MPVERVKSHGPLCISRGGAIARREDGRFVGLEPDPSRPTGQTRIRRVE